MSTILQKSFYYGFIKKKESKKDLTHIFDEYFYKNIHNFVGQNRRHTFVFLLSIFIRVKFHFMGQYHEIYVTSEAATNGVLYKKVFLEISENSQENTCVRVSFLIKLQAWCLQLSQKRDSGTGVFLWIL